MIMARLIENAISDMSPKCILPGKANALMKTAIDLGWLGNLTDLGTD